MWIVRLALRRPYTFVVLSLLIAVLGIGSAIETPKDIFPYINIPVVTVVWSYAGLTPTEMAGRIVTVCERAMTTTVNDIEHTESQSYQGVAIIKVYFQPGVQIAAAEAQVTAVVQTILKIAPPGTTPPFIIKYDASSVPILQLSLGGQGLSEADLYDLSLNFIRPPLATVQGASIPSPYGGKVRQVMIDTDPNLMYAHHLSAADVSTAMSQQNLILPAGTARIGDREFVVKTNSSPQTMAAMNDLPVRAANGAVVYIKDVAQVHIGYAVQTNIVRENGKRSALLTVLKNGNTSTLDIVSNVKQNLPRIEAGAGAVEDHAAVRPVDLCANEYRRGRARGDHRRRADRADDSAVSGILALDADCLHLDSSVDCDLAGDSQRPWRDDQRDDAGRHGAGGRHPG